VEYFTSYITNQSLGNPVERYKLRPCQPEFEPEEKHFASKKFLGIFSVYFVGRISEAAMGGP
jgi:hypothetical protein